MARKRDLDPAIWEHADLGSLPPQARLLFVAMISHADDEGRLKGDPRYLKGIAFRYDDNITVAKVREWRDALVTKGHVCRYLIGVDTNLHLPSWHRWQSINRRMHSKIPPCPEHGPCPQHEIPDDWDEDADDVSDHDALTEHSVNGHAAFTNGALTTGPDRAGTGTGSGTGTVTGTGPGPVRSGGSRGRAKPVPPPPAFRGFHNHLRKLRGYAPNAAFWETMADKWADLDLNEEAAKILDWLGRHPNRAASVQFLTNWLNRALADHERDKAARARDLAAVARPTVRVHPLCGTAHESWEDCPAEQAAQSA